MIRFYGDMSPEVGPVMGYDLVPALNDWIIRWEAGRTTPELELVLDPFAWGTKWFGRVGARRTCRIGVPLTVLKKLDPPQRLSWIKPVTTRQIFAECGLAVQPIGWADPLPLVELGSTPAPGTGERWARTDDLDAFAKAARLTADLAPDSALEGLASLDGPVLMVRHTDVGSRLKGFAALAATDQIAVLGEALLSAFVRAGASADDAARRVGEVMKAADESSWQVSWTTTSIKLTRDDPTNVRMAYEHSLTVGPRAEVSVEHEGWTGSSGWVATGPSSQLVRSAFEAMGVLEVTPGKAARVRTGPRRAEAWVELRPAGPSSEPALLDLAAD